MISDFPLVNLLGVGLSNKIPQDGDSQVVLPASVQPIVETLNPHLLVGSGTVAVQSVGTMISATKNNTGASSTTIMFLSPGLWDLRVMLTARFDYLSTGASPDVALDVLSGGNTVNLLAFYAAVGVQSGVAIHRFLWLNQVSIRITFDSTGVAETMDFNVSVNAIKVL